MSIDVKKFLPQSVSESIAWIKRTNKIKYASSLNEPPQSIMLSMRRLLRLHAFILSLLPCYSLAIHRLFTYHSLDSLQSFSCFSSVIHLSFTEIIRHSLAIYRLLIGLSLKIKLSVTCYRPAIRHSLAIHWFFICHLMEISFSSFTCHSAVIHLPLSGHASIIHL